MEIKNVDALRTRTLAILGSNITSLDGDRTFGCNDSYLLIEAAHNGHDDVVKLLLK